MVPRIVADVAVWPDILSIGNQDPADRQTPAQNENSRNFILIPSRAYPFLVATLPERLVRPYKNLAAPATASDPILADDDQLQRLFARLDPQGAQNAAKISAFT